jgi:hypothetical protein
LGQHDLSALLWKGPLNLQVRTFGLLLLCADIVEKRLSGAAVIHQLYVSPDEGAASCTMMTLKATLRAFFNTICHDRTSAHHMLKAGRLLNGY